jgi:hypothetical protein
MLWVYNLYFISEALILILPKPLALTFYLMDKFGKQATYHRLMSSVTKMTQNGCTGHSWPAKAHKKRF